jgi:hypothetical protein
MVGSLINRVMQRCKQPNPEVGMGITIYSYSDRSAGTITEVSKSGKSFVFQYDEAIRIDKNGMSDCQDYEYRQKPESQRYKAYKTKQGQWKIRKDGRVVGLGYRNFYHDYSF